MKNLGEENKKEKQQRQLCVYVYTYELEAKKKVSFLRNTRELRERATAKTRTERGSEKKLCRKKETEGILTTEIGEITMDVVCA